MKKINIIKANGFTGQEMDENFGGQLRFSVGDCFISDKHYYMQKETDMLHVNDGIINSVHNSALDGEDITKISKDEFIIKLKRVIFDLGIDEFTINML